MTSSIPHGLLSGRRLQLGQRRDQGQHRRRESRPRSQFSRYLKARRNSWNHARSLYSPPRFSTPLSKPSLRPLSHHHSFDASHRPKMSTTCQNPLLEINSGHALHRRSSSPYSLGHLIGSRAHPRNRLYYDDRRPALQLVPHQA